MDALVLVGPTLLRFFAGFIAMYFLGYSVFFRNWELKHRKEASSCLMSLAHGSPAVIMAVRALLHSQTLGAFADPNSALENTVLEFSMAYFLADLLHYMVFFPDETLFILHHLATLYVFVTCRYMIHHGAHGLLLLLILAEVTSACQNVWSIAGSRKADVPAAARLHEFLAVPFYALYSVVRGILGPVCLFKMGVFYLNGGAHGLIPAWAWISWMVVIGSAILVSNLAYCGFRISGQNGLEREAIEHRRKLGRARGFSRGVAVLSELAFAIVGLSCVTMPCPVIWGFVVILIGGLGEDRTFI